MVLPCYMSVHCSYEFHQYLPFIKGQWSTDTTNVRLQDTMPSTQDGLEAAIERIGEGGKWLWIMFLLVSTPGVFNIWHLTAYVFLGQALPHWCAVPELQAAHWTSEQIRNISSPG
jgi:hypothetical protein